MTYRVLLINPNTSHWVTEALMQQIRQVLPAGADIRIEAATATIGASYIASEVSYAIAAHALLDAYAAHFDGHDAIAVGCFGDPGTHALMQVTPAKVIGMAQAAMQEAAGAGRFAIVTGGRAWGPMLRRLAHAMGFDAMLADVVTIDRSAGELAANRPQAISILADTCRQAADQGAGRIILGGAAFAGYGDELAGLTGLTIIDSVSAFARGIDRAASGSADGSPDESTDAAPADAASYQGLATPLMQLLNR